MEKATPPRRQAVSDRLVKAVIRELPFFGPDDAVSLGGVSWDDYWRVAEAQEKLGRRLQISYAAGRLEVLPNSFSSEVRRSVLRSLVWPSAEAFGQEMYAVGSTTLMDRDGDYGFDPQESFCFRSASRGALDQEGGVSGGQSPGLVIEVENPRRVANRLPLFARAGVPEVWYDDLDTLRILSLQPDQTYSVTGHSPAFPLIPSHDLNRYLSLAHTNDLTAVAREFWAYLESLMPTLAS